MGREGGQVEFDVVPGCLDYPPTPHLVRVRWDKIPGKTIRLMRGMQKYICIYWIGVKNYSGTNKSNM